MLLIYVCVIRPLVYTVSALLPAAYIIGLIFTLKTHSHIYDIHVGEGQGMCLTVNDHLESHCYGRSTPHSLCSCRKPRSGGPLVKVEVLNHPRRGHCPHIRLC